MRFKLDFPISFPDSVCITYGAPIVLLGSCFSDDIGSKFKTTGFDILANPFGTIFHPLPLAEVIEKSLNGGREDEIQKLGEYYSSWGTSTMLNARSKVEAETLLTSAKRKMKGALSEASYLFITFGTAWGYRLLSNDVIVANCHKQPNNLFEKELAGVDKIVATWERLIKELKALNPKLNVVFTVSPVRHSKDGLVQNNRSKSRLIEACHQLCEKTSSIYFPSYEIVLDELRDHRFFKEDLVHPNSQAIDYVWERLQQAMMDQETREILDKVVKLKTEIEHRSLNPDSEEERIRRLRFKEKLSDFQSKYPEVKW